MRTSCKARAIPFPIRSVSLKPMADTDRKLSGNKKEIKKNNLAIRGSKEPLSPYGKFQNVFLSEKELKDIQQTIPDWKDYIERLSGYMASTGKQYQNHAATIISWARQDHPASQIGRASCRERV